MINIDRIINHPLYREELRKIDEVEADRIYCRHGISHFLDVARIAYILSLLEKSDYDKELIYAAALLHDIGRFKQIETGIGHNITSAEYAGTILEVTDFTDDEKEQIITAILNHRSDEASKSDGFSRLIYRADKQSRNCFMCKASDDCTWDMKEKNMSISF